MVKMLVMGNVSEKGSKVSNDGRSTYYTLFVVTGRRVTGVSVPKDVYEKYNVGDTVSLECDFFVNYDKKFTSIYIKE